MGGQALGFAALILILATIVTLAAMGQPRMAVTVTTAGLPFVVAIFVTGRYPPSSATVRHDIAEVGDRITDHGTGGDSSAL